MMVFRISFQRGNIAPRTLFDEPRQVVLQKLKGRPSLRIEGEKLSIENEVVLERGERLGDAGKAPVEDFLVARKTM